MKNNVKVFREKSKLTQQELADQLNVSRQTINSIENGRYDPSLSLAFKIAALMSVSIEEIFDPGDE